MLFRWQDITRSVSRISRAIRNKHLFPHSPLLSGMADPLSRFTNQIHPELARAKAWKQGILPAVGPVESAMFVPQLRWRLLGGKEAVERSKTNSHTDIHSNEKRHFTTHRGSTSISQTHLCHPVLPRSVKNKAEGWFSARFSQKFRCLMLLVSLFH